MKSSTAKRRSAKASPASKKSHRKRALKRSAVLNRYEDATWQFGERSWLPAAVQDSRLDADSSTRLELVRRSRYWSRNSPISIDCADIFAQYVVGPHGLQMIPSCSGANGEFDAEADTWDETAGRWWNAWQMAPAADSLAPLSVLQNQMAHSWWHDGELFVYKTFGFGESGRPQPRIQLIESHRFGTPPEKRSEEGRSIIDGVEFRVGPDGKPTGRPIRYWLRTDNMTNPYGAGYTPALYAGGNYKWIDASEIIYLGDPDRPGMVRALPKATGRMNDLHDLEDLQMMEKKAARDAAEITNVVTNKTGEASAVSMRRQKWQIQGQDAAGNPIVKQTPLFYEVTMGGRTVYVQNGEKFEQFKSERPSIATQGYLDYLVRKIAGPMWILILPQRIQGTQARGFYEVANTYFKTHTAVFAPVMRQIYKWALGWAVDYDRSLDGAPAEWMHADVIPPRSLIVDVGRNSLASLNELKAGIRTYKGECGEFGHDWRKVLRQKAIEAKFINDLVDEYQVTGRQIAELAAESIRVTEKVSETQSEIDAENPNPKPKAPEKTEGAPPAQNFIVNAPPVTVNVENKPKQSGKKTIKVSRDSSGRPSGYEIEETQTAEPATPAL